MNPSDLQDRLIDILLCEQIGGETAPDLSGRILDRAAGRPTARRSSWQWIVTMAASIALLAGGVWIATRPRRSGDALESTRGRLIVVGGGSVQRGATIATEDEPAELVLGGYARLELAADCRLRIQGEPGEECVFLESGEVTSEVTPGHGGFSIRTDDGIVRAIGTKFLVRVVPNQGAVDVQIHHTLVKVFSGVVLLSGMWGQLELTTGAESPMPPPAKPSPADDAKATRPVAAWDLVPFQVFDKPLHIGVVAFHETGCKVEFSVRAGDADAVAQTQIVENPTLNPQSSVWEYWFALDPKTLPDGPVEVRAKVIPLGAGMVVRELAPLPLHANGRGSLKFGTPVWVDCNQGDDVADGTESKPLKTLAAAVKKASDGGTIYVKAGKAYSANALEGGLKRTYWTVIAAAPGVKRNDIEIGPGRPGTDKLCFRGVTLYSDPPGPAYNVILIGENGNTVVWVDDCKMYNKKGRWGGGGIAFGNRYEPYVTGGLTTEMENGPGGILMRDHQIFKITSDAFTGVQTAINCSVEDIDAGQTEAHPDFHQSYVGDPNTFNTVILYNVRGKRCISQGFFGHNLRDSAFVNCLFHRGDTVMVSQYAGPLDHVLFIHLSLPNQPWIWRDDLQPRNCHIIDCLLASLPPTPKTQAAGLSYEALHVVNNTSPVGKGGTTGMVEFVDTAKLDFRPAQGSTAAAGGAPLQCVPADIDGELYEAKSPSRGCFQAANHSSTQHVRENPPVASAVIRPMLSSTGPRPSSTPNIVYKKIADGDWRMEDGKTKAPFNFANGGRDLLVRPGDKLMFKGVKFDGQVNLGPVWNYDNDNNAETEILLEDCLITGGLSVNTIGKMRVTVSHTRIDGMASFTPGPDSLITVNDVAIVAAHGGDAARIGRPCNQGKHPFGRDSRTPVVMRDCLIKTTGPANPGDHRDVMQVLGGSGITFTNVVFDLNSGEFSGPTEGQNACLFIEDGTNGSVSDIDIVDCWMLGSGSYFHMGIQKKDGTNGKNISLIRPRIAKGTTPLYPTDFPPFKSGLYKVESPVYSEDSSPIPLSKFGL